MPSREQRRGHPEALMRIAQDNGDDRRVAAIARVQAAIVGQFQEQPRPLPQAFHAVRLSLDRPQGFQGRGRVGRGDGRGEHKRRRRVPQVLHENLRAGQVAAAASQGLADGAHPDIALRGIDAEMLADSPARPPHHADRVRLVDIEHRLVTPFDIDESRQVGVVAVHAVDAFQCDHDAAIIRPRMSASSESRNR